MVRYITNDTSTYGNRVMVRHETNGQVFYSFYAHLSEIKVKIGDTVTAGTVVGCQGGQPGIDPNPGSSTGEHLHFEIRLTPSNESCVDPALYLAPADNGW